MTATARRTLVLLLVMAVGFIGSVVFDRAYAAPVCPLTGCRYVPELPIPPVGPAIPKAPRPPHVPREVGTHGYWSRGFARVHVASWHVAKVAKASGASATITTVNSAVCTNVPTAPGKVACSLLIASYWSSMKADYKTAHKTGQCVRVTAWSVAGLSTDVVPCRFR